MVVSTYGCNDAGTFSSAEVRLPARFASEAPGNQRPEPEATLATECGLTTGCRRPDEQGRREKRSSGEGIISARSSPGAVDAEAQEIVKLAGRMHQSERKGLAPQWPRLRLEVVGLGGKHKSCVVLVPGVRKWKENNVFLPITALDASKSHWVVRVCLSGPRQSDRDGWRSSVNSGLQGCQISMFWDPGSTPWPEDPAAKGGSKTPTPMPFVNRPDPDQLSARCSQNFTVGPWTPLVPSSLAAKLLQTAPACRRRTATYTQARLDEACENQIQKHHYLVWNGCLAECWDCTGA